MLQTIRTIEGAREEKHVKSSGDNDVLPSTRNYFDCSCAIKIICFAYFRAPKTNKLFS